MTALRNNKLPVAVIAAALAAAAFWFLVLSPKRKEAADLQTKISAQQSQMAQAQQEIATYLKARRSYRANYAILTRLGKAVPADDDIRSFMVQLNTAADSTHVDFAKLDVSGADSASATPASTTTSGTLAPPPGTEQVGTTGISAMPFTLTFNGSYFNLADFFARLDRYVRVHNDHVRASGRLLRVESITLAPAQRGFPHMTAQVVAATYLVAPSGAPGSPSAGGTTPAAGSQATPASTPSPTTPSTPSTTSATVTGAAR